MNIAILGAGAMGSAIGGLLFAAHNEVTLIDVSKDAVDSINREGLKIQSKNGAITVHRIRAVSSPAQIANRVDLLIVFVKCYHTAAAVQSAASLVGPNTVVLSLQNGWGNGPRIASILGADRIVLGVCYHSATVLAPGHVLHAGQGKTFIGELDGTVSSRVRSIADTFNAAGIPVEPSGQVLREIWSKLALNVATLPTSSSIRISADQLLTTAEMRELMRGLLKEVVAVAQAQNITLDLEERWQVITDLLGKLAPGSKGSMFQDVEKRRATEIDVMCGAIIEGGRQAGLPTPYNEVMFYLIKALEATFPRPSVAAA